jgi:hypothetical protein
MKTTLKLVAILLTACAGAHAQVVPAATGPRGLPVSGNLDYSFRYSETSQFGGSLGNQERSTASGDLEYSNGSTRLPFNLSYGGGYIWNLAGTSYVSGFFQHLLISQGYVGRHWSVVGSDNVSYMPASPTTGFSGIPGEGGSIGGTGSGTPSSQSILTLNTRTVSNIASGEFQHELNYATNLSLGGSSELLRFPDGNGLDTNMQMANAGLNRRLDARDSLSGQYIYFHYSYGGIGFTDQANTALFGYQRQWSRSLSSSVSVGPQWISSSDSATVPSSTTVAANASVNYLLRFGSAGLYYSRGMSGGAGYLLGAEVDSAGVDLSREFGRNVTLGFEGSYRRTSGLINNGVTDAEYGGAQIDRRLGRYINLFANYTAINQSSSSPLPTNALNQLLNVISFGIGYSPRGTHLRQ